MFEEIKIRNNGHQCVIKLNVGPDLGPNFLQQFSDMTKAGNVLNGRNERDMS